MEVIAIAEQMIAGGLDLIEGCRKLVPHLRAVGLRDDPYAKAIVGVESETDEFPLGPERQNWDPAALAAKDLELAEYVARVREDVMVACRAIVGRLSPS
jgi:hypothetical protein